MRLPLPPTIPALTRRHPRLRISNQHVLYLMPVSPAWFGEKMGLHSNSSYQLSSSLSISLSRQRSSISCHDRPELSALSFTGIDKHYCESILLDPSQPKAFLHYVWLELTTPRNERSIDDPNILFIRPQSQLYFYIHHPSCSDPLPPFPETIRVPTRITFLDSLITAYLDPPSGRTNSRFNGLAKTWIAYLFT